MATVKVFLSFEFGKDNDLHRNFYVQAKEHSKYRIIDKSLNEAYHPDKEWLKKARALIKQSDIVITVIGQDTHNAPGVEKEATVAGQLYKQRFQLRSKHSTGGEVAGAGDVIPWKWPQIDAKIQECLKNQQG